MKILKLNFLFIFLYFFIFIFRWAERILKILSWNERMVMLRAVWRDLYLRRQVVFCGVFLFRCMDGIAVWVVFLDNG